ncbi:MAG: hypothetical protein KKF46_01415 [Nanoarchaeota archaeon]|nr:hypothetical protein [Nanoarchaeota archaeon]MBU1320992.1 hypothetical protein [Nanoarchaeota archaeon]MBU1596863.1 hypothetical protein [Nanoarchaeota archaeon]MBU2440798.1 hypothetical protein [Nanoarchaeota archaeon]
MAELDAKINKISERLDELELAVNPHKSEQMDIKLSPREQEVFMILYLSRGKSIQDVSKRLGFTQDRVNLYLMNLMSKGVPVKKEIVDDVLVFSLESEFKDLQARRNILEIDPRIAKTLSMHKM